MLQQTQVKTVIPYFERWLQSFPDIKTLADAPLDDVLAHWAGLGYYARARNLHKTATICMEQHRGNLPASAEELNALPGIGQSTANAIISQSTDRPAAVLDGNVRRVLARHAGIEGWTGKAAVQKQLWKEAESRLPISRGADYTQAVMDLGATLCSRSNPECDKCPVSRDCEALILGKVRDLPSPKPATKVSEMTLYLLILRDQAGRVLLEKRAPAGIWGGLWCLPSGESIEGINRTLGIGNSGTKGLPPRDHRLSHIRMTLKPVLASAKDARQVRCSPQFGWFDREQQESLGLPKPITQLLKQLSNGEFE